MSKAFVCDRCGNIHKGFPSNGEVVGDTDNTYYLISIDVKVKQYSKDLCNSCLSTLLQRVAAKLGGQDV